MCRFLVFMSAFVVLLSSCVSVSSSARNFRSSLVKQISVDVYEDAGSKTFVFDALPSSVSEMRATSVYGENSPFAVAALTVAALCSFSHSRQNVFLMLDDLNGNHIFTAANENFLSEKLAAERGGHGYLPFSYFDGASPENAYEPSRPYKITVCANETSYAQEGYARLFVKSSGDIAERSVTLRRGVDGKWFVAEFYSLLNDIAVPGYGSGAVR